MIIINIIKYAKSSNNTHHLFKIFSERGYRLTTPRKAILNTLIDSKEHPSVEEVYFDIVKDYPSIGITTVYRTFDLLVTWGVVHKFDFGEGKARYELVDNIEGSGHHHIICCKCKKIINSSNLFDNEDIIMSKLRKKLSKKYAFSIRNYIIEFHGICRECNNKKKHHKNN